MVDRDTVTAISRLSVPVSTGTSARIPRGTAFTAILDEDLPFIMGAPAGDMLAQSALATTQQPMSDGGETEFRNGVPQ